MRMVSSLSGEKPGRTSCSLMKLRIISPAPASRITETATWATTSALRKR